jgi:hypothetical protein
MELVREILMQVEGGPPGQTWIDVAINGYDKNTIAEQVRLLSDAGYLVARDHGDDWKPVRLTWDGKDFLSAAKNKTIWSGAKRRLERQGARFSLLRLKKAMIAAVKELYAPVQPAA